MILRKMIKMDETCGEGYGLDCFRCSSRICLYGLLIGTLITSPKGLGNLSSELC